MAMFLSQKKNFWMQLETIAIAACEPRNKIKCVWGAAAEFISCCKDGKAAGSPAISPWGIAELWNILGWKGPPGLRELLLPCLGCPAGQSWFLTRCFPWDKGSSWSCCISGGILGFIPAREQRGIHSLLGLQFVEDFSDFTW